MTLGNIGTTSPIDNLLAPYFPGRDGLLHQLLEDENAALQAAILMELQRQNGNDPLEARDERPDQQEAEYFVTEQPLPVTSVNQTDQHINWGFPATSVQVWGFDAPIYVAFRESGDNRLIPLDPKDAPYNAGPEGGLGSSSIWIRKPSEGTNDTTIKVKAYK
ncbi:hypothetical protein [Natronosalvus halobius]|uniref:hypothetical protein n=1 Tax=Natronosalvus halobius TaxID=2953746 RepID=UPI00209D650A|nr:hypothetical protein [Natronosalvus halobius]USZ73233.1 hypothetical protein NGM15_08035 [Natronosalvus halobius]